MKYDKERKNTPDMPRVRPKPVPYLSVTIQGEELQYTYTASRLSSSD